MRKTINTFCGKSLILAFIFLLSLQSMFAQKTEKKQMILASKKLTLSPYFDDTILKNISSHKKEFLQELQHLIANTEPDLLLLVDKKHHLSANYIPKDIIPLKKNRAYIRNRTDLSLRRRAEKALHDMSATARKDGVKIVVSSSYRSYAYQKNLFARYCREYGEKTAETFSARPGTSQHQLGTVVDFGSIDDSFAKTAAGKWIKKYAGRYGWSLSFPRNYDEITGYVWESWHYRYIGVEACAFQKKWFGDIQQFMLEFIHAYNQ